MVSRWLMACATAALTCTAVSLVIVEAARGQLSAPAEQRVAAARLRIATGFRAQARQRFVHRPVRSQPARNTQDPRALQVLQLYLREAPKQAYAGEQTTQVIAGGLQSTETVVHGGPGRERIEFRSPERMAGEVILRSGPTFLHYVPQRHVILEGVVSAELFEGHVRELMQGVRTGRVSLRLVGSQIVAGQPASVIEIRSLEGGWRLYIDDRTGVRLKGERLSASGNVTQTSYFTSINYAAPIDPTMFMPRSLPRVRHEPAMPAGRPLQSVAEAQQQVAYTIREPALPAGFRLVGVWVVEAPSSRKVTVLRYTDGANTFTLWEQPARANAAQPQPPRRNLRHWVSGSVAYTLIGNLRPESQAQIADSLQ